MAKRLISPAQIATIKNVLEDVTFTFFDTDITYLAPIGAFDRFNEDVSLTMQYTEHRLKCFFEEDDLSSDSIDKMPGGALDFYEVKVTFNAVDLDRAGLMITDVDGGWKASFVVADGYFRVGADKYRIEKVYTDGKFDKKAVLVVALLQVVKI